MTPTLILSIFLGYFAILFAVSIITTRKSSNNAAFFTGNRKSPWFIVAFGMIGASLSGVTFISVPGWVSDIGFSYMMVVFGYVFGYYTIAHVLLPLYYRMKLTSIYTYLEERLGFWSYKSGASFFLISRVIGASFRMFLVINVLQIFVFDKMGIPFWVSVIFFLVLINLYTMRGGIKTIIWTDTLQTICIIAALLLSGYLIVSDLNWSFTEFSNVIISDYIPTIINTDVDSPHYFLKDFLSGIFITIVMTGLDQDMMQKNLSCRNVKDAKKNMITLGWILVPVNFLFLCLGAAMIIFASKNGITFVGTTDDLFPTLAFNNLGIIAGTIFLIGLTAAAYSSADSALTALTTSFSIDFLNFEKTKKWSQQEKIRIRKIVHICITLLLIIVIIIFKSINNEAVISQLFKIAGYTYGPLLGMYSFGLFTKHKLHDRLVPYIVIASPIICYLLSLFSKELFWGYSFGFEILILNGIITFIGLWFIRKS